MSFTIGSLFDGSGGFPLAATMCGGTPVWASEVEPFPIAVTWSRFPNMKHLGSVTDINGGEVEPVDIISFGSPCQDLSVAGKRAGLKHEENGDDETTRSGLFMEAVRIIKEMRKATNGVYPRFAIWENVPGAFSSNKGEDFRTVLEELIKIVEPSAVMPPIPKNGWPYADSYCGEGWSLAYRVFDAQYWGVPQRRRRIYLVVDFRGECAGEILFEREGLRGYFETGRTPWQGTASDAQGCPGADDRDGTGDGIAYGFPLGFRPENVRVYEETATTLCNGTRPGFTTGIICMATQQGGAEIRTDDKAPTVTAAAGMSGNNQPVVCYSDMVLDDQGGSQISVRAETHGNVPAVMEPVGVMASSAVNAEITDGKISPCLMARAGTGGNQLPLVALTYDARGNGDGAVASTITGDPMNTLTGGDRHAVAYCIGNGQVNDAVQTEKEICKTLNCMVDPMKVCIEEPIVVLDRAFFNQGQNAKFDPAFYTDGTVPTLVARGPSAVAVRYIVRRLTPTECARLQGFADRWATPIHKDDFTDEEYRFWLDVRNTHAEINGKAVKDYTKEQMLKWYNNLHTDSSEYKLWGNGIALPCALYVMQGIADAINH